MTPFLLAPLLSPLVQAQEAPARVFVSEFQARDASSAGLASLMSSFLVAELGAHPELEATGPDDVPRIGDYDARLYLDSCPPEQAVGCAWVAADGAGIPYAVTGVIEHAGDGSRVELSIIDVDDAREAISLQVMLGVGDDERFAAGIAELVVAVVRGEAGRLEDIREGAPIPTRSLLDDAAVARQLDQLSKEMGEITTLGGRVDRHIERPRYTMESLHEDMDSDAAKPWELAGMTPGEYLHYRNSGMALPDWRRRRAGRRAQILLGPVAGFLRGPVDTRYEGRYAEDLDGQEIVVVERYAWQAVQDGTGALAGAWLGYGLLPSVELELGGGVLGGRYTLRINSEQVGQPPDDRSDGETRQQWIPWAGARVLVAPMPIWRARPTLGAGAAWSGGHAYTDFWQEHPEMAPFPAPWLLEVQLVPGGELDLGDRLELTLGIPVGVVVAGGTLDLLSEGEPVLQGKDAPPAISGLSAGVELGFKVRFREPKVSGAGTGREPAP